MVPSHGVQLRDQRGFTLIELMIVVAVISILAIVVVPTFFREGRKTKSSTEVVPMFAEMALKQEQIRLETGSFLDGGTCPALVPTAKYAASDCTASASWTSLRIAPPTNQLRCQYTMTVGAPATAASPPTGFTFVAPATQAWYFLHAVCDGDGAGGTNAEYFATSVDSKIISRNEAN